MTSRSLLLGWTTSTLGSLILAGALAAQPQPVPPATSFGAVGSVFAAGLKTLGLLFSRIGSLSGGATVGAVWRVDVRTGERQRIGNATDLAWPVPSPDGTGVYALRDRQVVHMEVADGREIPVGVPADWRKLLGVLPDGTVLGFVEDDPRPRPALLAPGGDRTELPPPADAERKRNGALLQEGRDYADGTRLEVQDSTRGGRGRDVFLIDSAGSQKNLTDCGDNLCGQPSRSQDGLVIIYIRGPRR
jgi:hypothetical protein